MSFIPSPLEANPRSTQISKQAATQPSKAPAQLAKQSPPVAQEPDKTRGRLSEKEQVKEQPDNPRPRRTENEAMARRSLPTVRELMPQIYSSHSEGGDESQEGPIWLDSKEPKYLSYRASVKQAIELEWVYPDAALRHGLQGKLILQFSILGTGQLEAVRLVRSSGVSMLDQEAIRAVQAAAPFPPIPPWLGKKLEILAAFEYVDNRVKYDFAR